MRLLVSVRDAEEASAALAGGADLIDAKDPAAGALGAVSLAALNAIVTAIGGARPVTAALGDAADTRSLEDTARAYAGAGARLVKIGFAGISSPTEVRALLDAARRGAEPHTGVIAVAYADADLAGAPDRNVVLDAAVRTGATGVLLDTAGKDGPGLRGLVRPASLRAWVIAAREAGLLVALAGTLGADDLEFVRDAGADIAGVRGAACDGGRIGRVDARRVRRLLQAARRSAPAPAPGPVAAS